jgi:DNA-directed RNA polymerase specialized sigma24 family protein
MFEPPAPDLSQLIGLRQREWRAFATEASRVQRLYAPILESSLRGLAESTSPLEAVKGFLDTLSRNLDEYSAALRDQHGYDLHAGRWLQPPPSTEIAAGQFMGAFNQVLYTFLSLDRVWQAAIAAEARGEDLVAAVVLAVYDGPRQLPAWLAEQGLNAATSEAQERVLVDLAGAVAANLKIYASLKHALQHDGRAPRDVLPERIGGATWLAWKGRQSGEPFSCLVNRVESVLGDEAAPAWEASGLDEVHLEDFAMREEIHAAEELAELPARAAAARLSPREALVYEMLQAELTTAEIVDRTGWSSDTATSRVHETRVKLRRARG